MTDRNATPAPDATSHDATSPKPSNKTSKKTMTGAGILYRECLEREGVKQVFGYPGGAILPAYDALKHSKIHHILVRHEQGATHMADGYARACGGRWRRSSDIRTGRDEHGYRDCHGHARFVPDRLYYGASRQQVDRVGCISGDGYHGRDASDHQAQLSGHARRAKWRARCGRLFYVARSGRPGPVLIDITKDAQQSTCEFDWEAARAAIAGLSA